MHKHKEEERAKNKLDKMDGVSFEPSEQSIRKMVKQEIANSLKAKSKTGAKPEKTIDSSQCRSHSRSASQKARGCQSRSKTRNATTNSKQ